MEKNRDVIAIYSRKSRFTGKGESIGNQVELCRAYLRATYGEDYAETAIIFEDEGFSGGNLNRPDFQRMMKAARKHQFRAVVVYRLDRISRNIGDFSALIQELGQLGIDFISIRESFDTSSPMGRAMMYIASVFSQLERETIAERIRDNMRELAKTGRWLGGNPPTGYTSEAVKTIQVDGKSKRSCTLKLIPEEAEVVRKIYKLFCETCSLTATEAELLRQRYKTKTGCNFTRFSIKAILQNPVYLIADREAQKYFEDRQADFFAEPDDFDGIRGILAYNRTAQEKGRATTYLPVGEWIVSVGRHPGIISSGTWIRVQEILEGNKSGAYRQPRKNEALLTGLLWCSCGSRMYPKLSGRRKESSPSHFHYVCKMKERSRRSRCMGENINGVDLDHAILSELDALEGDRLYFLHLLEQKQKLYIKEQQHSEDRMMVLKREKAEKEKKMESLVDSLLDTNEDLTKELITKRIGKLHEECREIEHSLQELKRLRSQEGLGEAELQKLSERLSVFPGGFSHMSLEQRRVAIHAVVRKITWNGEEVHLFFSGSEDDESLGEGSK